MKRTLITLALAATTLLSAVASAESYAIVIGINDYPEPVDAKGNPLKDDEGNVLSDDLKGCVNDANYWKETLAGKFGFKASNIHLLLDKNANEEGFIREIRWIIQNAKAGDKVFFSYSGHGSQVELDDQPEEADGLTEVICLQDTLIPDNFFADMAKTLREQGVDATFVFDSCFSGGIDKDVSKNKRILRNKRVPGSRLNAKQRANHLDGIEAAQLLMAAPTARAPKKGSYAFLMASQENQTSSDVEFLNNVYPPQGAFTFIVKAIMEDDSAISIEELIDAVKSELKAAEFEQIPKAEYSDANRPAKPVIG